MQLNTKDVFALVTATLCERLHHGNIPWHQNWKQHGPPRNLITERPYRGVNLLLLGNLGYSSNEFLTYKQAIDLGAKVNKGAKAHLQIFWHVEDANGTKKVTLRYYYLFNVTDCKDLPPRPKEQKSTVIDPVEHAEMILADMPSVPQVIHLEDTPYYNLKGDFINVVKADVLGGQEQYYSHLFPLLAHATSHESRLDRKEGRQTQMFEAPSFELENLIADIAGGFLISHCGLPLPEIENKEAYREAWIRRMSKDHKFIMTAASQAQKAVDYILNVKHKEDENVAVSHGT